MYHLFIYLFVSCVHKLSNQLFVYEFACVSSVIGSGMFSALLLFLFLFIRSCVQVFSTRIVRSFPMDGPDVFLSLRFSVCVRVIGVLCPAWLVLSCCVLF